MPGALDANTKPDMNAHLRSIIRAGGPLTLETYMSEVLTHPTLGYYTTQEPFGAAGDFITAPEVSQMFGELIGAWCAHTWAQMASPERVCLVEMGPGRGTLMKDLLRAVSKTEAFAEALEVHLVEISHRLREIQRQTLGDTSVTWHESLADIPSDVPMVLVANELLDALPIRQFERTVQGWCERLVDVAPSSRDDGTTSNGFRFVLTKEPSAAAAMLPPEVRDAPLGAVAEVSPAAVTLVADISRRLLSQGGAALLIDCGSDSSGARDTLQAVAHHKTPPGVGGPRHGGPVRPCGFRHARPSRGGGGRGRLGPGDAGVVPHRTGDFRAGRRPAPGGRLPTSSTIPSALSSVMACWIGWRETPSWAARFSLHQVGARRQGTIADFLQNGLVSLFGQIRKRLNLLHACPKASSEFRFLNLMWYSA